MIYETAQDREREAAVLSAYERVFDTTVLRTPRLFPIDGVSSKHVLEVKVRNHVMELYPTYAIDVKKVEAVEFFAGLLRRPGLLLVGWEDSTRYVPTDHWWAWSRSTLKRRDRGDAEDRVVLIPLSEFVPI